MKGGEDVTSMGDTTDKHADTKPLSVIVDSTLEYLERLSGAYRDLRKQGQPTRVLTLSGTLATLSAHLGGMGDYTMTEIQQALRLAADSMDDPHKKGQATVELKGDAQRKVNWES